MNFYRQTVLSPGLVFLLLAGMTIGSDLCLAVEKEEGKVFPMVEISFHLPDKTTNPFAQEIWGRIQNSEGEGIWLPAFFDGEGKWRLRYSPRAKGEYRVRIFSGDKQKDPLQAVDLQPETFRVEGEAVGHGLVRVNPDRPQSFIREDGEPYFPVGINIGWDSGQQGDVVAFLERLKSAGGNWSRIWMCHWDDKNLDWPQGRKIPPGEIDPAAALKWDRIVAAGDRLQIPFQMVLQHHGQYSANVDSCWKENPWNKANGGFLEKATDFFSDPQARLLTKRKYRYIVARYGYSPSIMAWELFNEVEFTDAWKTAEGQASVLKWHQEMAEYLRSIDPWHHLITTSALPLQDPVWKVTDYYQQHSYPPDPLTGAGGFAVNPSGLEKPIFYGEIGSMDSGGQTLGDGGRVLRNVLWSGIFAGADGTAQYWSWDQADRERMYPLISGMAKFAEQAELGRGVWRSIRAGISTAGKSDLVFGPGQRWESVVDPDLHLPADGSGRPEGVGFSAMLRPRRGSGEKVGTDSVTFHLGSEKAGRCEVTVNEVSKDGAKMELEGDGKVLVTQAWPPLSDPKAARQVPFVLGVDFPAGTKTLSVKSNGPDYFQISSVRLKDYVSELGIKAMTNDRNVVLWIYRQDGLSVPPLQGEKGPFSNGTVHLEGLLDGKYHVLWWNTGRAVAIREEESVVSGGKVDLLTPPVSTDVAVLMVRQEP